MVYQDDQLIAQNLWRKLERMDICSRTKSFYVTVAGVAISEGVFSPEHFRKVYLAAGWGKSGHPCCPVSWRQALTEAWFMGLAGLERLMEPSLYCLNL